MNVSVKKIHPAARLPVYATEEAAGADLCACLEAPVTIGPGETVVIPTGLAVAPGAMWVWSSDAAVWP